MAFDLHVRKLDKETYEKIKIYGYRLILVDEISGTFDGRPKIIIRKKIGNDAKTAKKPKPILHVPITNFEAAIGLIKRYPNRVRCVEVDLKELREEADKALAFKNLERFSNWLSKRKIPLLFSSGAESVEDVVTPMVLFEMVRLVYPKVRMAKHYRSFYKFLEGLEHG